jgi:hypothetical protein
MSIRKKLMCKGAEEEKGGKKSIFAPSSCTISDKEQGVLMALLVTWPNLFGYS